jgi:hypothetical protein
MISKCSRGIWEVCIVMEHKEEWCPKAQTHSKLLCRPNCAGIIIQLFAIPPPTPPPKKQTNNIKCKCTHTPTASSKVGFINKWEPGDGEVYSTCSIPKGEHCQALWHALHSSAPRPQSWYPFAPTCCPNKLPFPFGFVPPHTSTTTISYQEMPHAIVSRESMSDMLPQSPSKSSSLRTEDDLN